jgi:hypothetical protein
MKRKKFRVMNPVEEADRIEVKEEREANAKVAENAKKAAEEEKENNYNV